MKNMFCVREKFNAYTHRENECNAHTRNKFDYGNIIKLNTGKNERQSPSYAKYNALVCISENMTPGTSPSRKFYQYLSTSMVA